MANGSHYTVSDYDQDKGSTIEKYSYNSGKKVSTIVTALDALKTLVNPLAAIHLARTKGTS